jgi:predicted acetyltransferase
MNRATLELRPFTLADESAAVKAWSEFRTDEESVDFLTFYEEGQSWSQYIERMAEYSKGRNLPPGHVVSDMLAAVVDGVLVGSALVRYELTQPLSSDGGHITYCVIKEHRRKGYATEILLQALRLTAERGMTPALLTCDDDNVASARVIERCGGQLENTLTSEWGDQFRCYWISCRKIHGCQP